MPISKVNSNYQVTIPKGVRIQAKINRGDSVMVEYDEEEGVVKVKPPMKGKRTTWKLGSRLTMAEIETTIERGQASD
jgi:AbrB family looped-hinge helix DNA binding protein